MGRIADFLNLYGKRNTKIAYRSAIRLFFDIIYNIQRSRGKSNETANEELYENLADRYFKELESGERIVSRDLLLFADFLQDKPPLSARARVTATKEFLLYYGVEISHQDTKNFRRKLPKGNARTEERDLDRELLRKILQHCDLKGRALLLMMVSSGMRIGECLLIKEKDMHLKKNPAEIHIRGEYTKTGEKRTVFISREAVEAVQAWLNFKDAYLKTAATRNKGLIKSGLSNEKNIEDSRVFPFGYSTVRDFWQNALVKAGELNFDETTNRKDLHPHMLRKFFRTQSAVKIPVDIIESLMGHSGYLTAAYRKYTKKQFEEAYLKAEPVLTIFIQEDPETQQRVREINDNMASMMMENQHLKIRLQEMEMKMYIYDRGLPLALTNLSPELLALFQNPEKIKELNKLPELLKSLQ